MAMFNKSEEQKEEENKIKDFKHRCNFLCKNKVLIFIWMLATIGAMLRLMGIDPYMMRLKRANPGKITIVR